MVTCDLKVISYQSQTILADTVSKLLGPYRFSKGCTRYLQVFGTICIQRDCYFKVLRDKF